MSSSMLTSAESQLKPEAPAEAPEVLTLDASSLDGPMLEKLRKKAKGDLYFFAKGVLGFDKLHPRIHKPLCRLLELYNGYDSTLAHSWPTYERVLKWVLRRAGMPKAEHEDRIKEIRSDGIKKLMILMPRGWYKTTLVSISYPIWRGVRDTNVRVLLAQNTSTNAKSKGSALGQAILGSPLLAALFPEVMPGPREKWNEEGRTLKREGAWAESTYEFAGTKTQVTSRHFNLIIEDDTVAPDKDDLGESSILPSKVDISQAIGWHRLVPPLLDEVATDQNVVVGTRWFVLDLLAWVMQNEKDFVVFQWAVKEDSHGKPAPMGSLVWPERFTEKVVVGLAASLGPYLYSCLYMNTPVQSEDMFFKESWVRFYDVEPPRLMTFTTVDLGGDPLDTKGTPDFNVVLTCGKDMAEGKIYVLDYSHEQCSPSRTLEMIFEHVRKWHPATVGLETVAYQKSLMHWIRQRQVTENVYFSVTQLTHTKVSKGARIRGLQPAMAGGVMFFRPYMTALVNELLVYPLGTHDDLADALAMQLELWRISPSARESAKRSEGGPNDFTTVLEIARETQKAVDSGRAERAGKPKAAWGMSIPNLVFHPPNRPRGIRRAGGLGGTSKRYGF